MRRSSGAQEEKALLVTVAHAMVMVVRRCVDGEPGMGGEVFVTEGRNLFVRLSDRRERYGEGFVGEGWGNGTIGGAEER